MKTISSCPLCEKSEFTSFLTLKDYMITQEEFIIVRCKNCGFHFTNPIPEQEMVSRYYQNEAYVSHSSSKKGFINFIYNRVRNITLKQKARWIKKHTKGQRLLDIGCGTGHFTAFMAAAGFSVSGLEPDPIARENAKTLNNFSPLPIEELYNLPPNSFDAITMWHVLEHVYNLKEDCVQYERLLDKNGVLFVAVPNLESYDAKYYKEYWAAYDVPRHLYHFRKNDLVQLFSPLNLTLVATLPMKFDSYYVSMLSEKYKKGSVLNAIRIGKKSNRLAKKLGYSSQVYVFQKK